MSTVASRVPFSELVGLLERISKKTGTDAKKRLMKEFITQWRKLHSEMHCNNPNTKDSFFPAMRLLLPQLEKERDAYGIKEHTLAKHYIDILGLGKDSPNAQKLLNYRAPKNARGDAGDFAQIAYFVLQSRCPDKGNMTIEQVNQCLDEIAAAHAGKNKDGTKKDLFLMLREMTALEQKWLIRMILKEMKMGISQQSIFSLFHIDAEDLFNVKMSLEKVCEALMDPSVRLHEIEVSLFSPFRPMLGDRGAPSKVEKDMEGKSYFIETKYDGERMQLHKGDDQYKYFSRGGNDYSAVYGETPFDGNFTPHISNCFKENVSSCILDGEMVGYNPVTEVRGSKGENFDIKSTNTGEYQAMLCVFDVLMLNGQVLSNKPLRERKCILKDVFTPVDGRMILSEYTEGITNQDCADALNQAIDDREEGIMIKNPDSFYKPATRKGGWYKIKPEYMNSLMDELDVIVIGGYMGKGHRSHVMSHFLCAVAVPSEDGDKPKEFHSFCRVGSGYTRKELYEFNKKLQGHWQVFDRRRLPPHLMLATGLKQKPDAWIEPSNSCILQIKAAEIIKSDQFKTGCTLRFPRVERIRDDKLWYECMTTIELEDLKQKSDGKLVGKYAGVDEEEEHKKKRRKVATTHFVKLTVASQFKGVDVSTVTKVSEILAGKEICVMNGSAAYSKPFVEKKVVECGGTIVQNPGEDTMCVLCDKVSIKVKNIISKGLTDVVKLSWLINCAEQKRLLPWIPSDMIHTSPKTASLLSQEYDKYGDSYYQDVDEKELQNIFAKIKDEHTAMELSSEDIAQIEMKYFPQDSPHGIFRLCRAHLDSNLVLGKPETHIKACSLELVGLEMRLYGATLTDSLDDQVSHVIVHSNDTSRVKSFREINKKRSKKFHIVTEDWVNDCITEEKVLSERLYDPPT